MKPDGPALDARQVRRAFARAAATYGEAAVVPREVERRLAERLELIRQEPRRILDAGAGWGTASALLRARYRRAKIIALDASPEMLREGRRRRGLLERARAALGAAPVAVCADFARLPLPNASVAMVWSNLALAWAIDATAVLAEFHRVLEPGGLLLFSTYGPDSLKELRESFAAVDAHAHVHDFVDMHDLGDALVGQGFATPVMEMEALSVTYPDLAALASDLRRTGQQCAASDRRRGLMTPRAWRRVEAEYERRRAGRVLPATAEIVYGHAWKGARQIAGDGRRIVQPPRTRKAAR